MTTKTNTYNTKLINRLEDLDGTVKYVYNNNKGTIEVSKIVNKEGIDVYCIPSHYYCTLGCTFCYLTTNNLDGKIKSMRAIYHLELVEVLDDVLKESYNDKILFSFMGVGDSFLSSHLITEIYYYYALQKNKTISMALATIMPKSELTQRAISYFSKLSAIGMPLKITFSLHSPIDNKRVDIIPSGWTVDESFKALDEYRDSILLNTKVLDNISKFHSSSSPVLIHYTIIKDVNDSEEELRELIRLGNAYKIPLKILKFNPSSDLEISPREGYWKETLEKEYKSGVVFYQSPGSSISSSCGMFLTDYYKGGNKNYV